MQRCGHRSGAFLWKGRDGNRLAGPAAHVPNEPWAHTLQLRDIQKKLPSFRVMGRVAVGREAKLGCCSPHAPGVSVDTVIHFAAVETCLPRGFSFLFHILMAF